jgi:hypothetical protein
MYPFFLISLSGSDSYSQRLQNETEHSRSNQQLNIEDTTAQQPQLHQVQSPKSDVLIELGDGSSNVDNA